MEVQESEEITSDGGECEVSPFRPARFFDEGEKVDFVISFSFFGLCVGVCVTICAFLFNKDNNNNNNNN